MASVPGLFNIQQFTDSGMPAANYRLYTYVQGVTTFKSAYTDVLGTISHTYTNDGIGGQYIALNARGELPVPLYLSSGAYDIALKRPDGSTVWTKRADGTALDDFSGSNGVFSSSATYLAGTIGAWLQGVIASAGSSFMGFIHAGTGAVARTVQARLRDRISPLDYGCIGDGVADDTAALTLAFAAIPAYGAIDLLGKTYSVTSPPGRPAIGVTVRDGKIKLNNNAATLFYGLVANDYCVFDGIYFLGTGVTGTIATATFTASVGGGASGTLTASIANGSYLFTFANGNTRYVSVTGGTGVVWTPAITVGTVLTATYPNAARYQGGIIGGNTGYPAPMNSIPANYVTVRNCTFDSLTVGVWSGGATADPVPTGWHVVDNNFVNIVGVPGLSEGYGVLFTPSNNGSIRGNTFKTIRRHAVYLAGESSNNTVTANSIDGVDNIAIQSNTGVTQNYADGNVISNNSIRGFTKSVTYGYRSSIGIGLYGKVSNAIVSGNRMLGALDTGIDTAGELAGSPYSDRLFINGNSIVLDPTATDAGIRIDGLQSGKVANNHIVLQNSNYGVIVTAAVGASTTSIDITNNTIETSNTSAQGFRVLLTGSRIVRIFQNTLNGFVLGTYVNAINDTSTNGIVRTDLNKRTGIVSTDADFTHNSGGTVSQTDCPTVRHTGTLSVTRTITLTETNVDAGNTFTVMRVGGGAGALNIRSGAGATIKALGSGQWATFVYNQSSQWEVAASGLL